MSEIKRIGVLTSGGDCAGLNAVISSVVSAAEKRGWEIYGIHDGTEGITDKEHRYEERDRAVETVDTVRKVNGVNYTDNNNSR